MQRTHCLHTEAGCNTTGPVWNWIWQMAQWLALCQISQDLYTTFALLLQNAPRKITFCSSLLVHRHISKLCANFMIEMLTVSDFSIAHVWTILETGWTFKKSHWAWIEVALLKPGLIYFVWGPVSLKMSHISFYWDPMRNGKSLWI